MTKIQILGAGCPKCRALAAAAESVAEDMGIEFELEKVTDINDILAFGVMMTPALVVDGQVKVAGKVPGAAELREMLAST